MTSQAQIEANRKNAANAGRPVASTTLQTQMMRLKLQQYLDEHIPAMVDAQVEKARKGDTQAFIALMDRAFGKPAQALTGADGSALFPSEQEKQQANDALLAFLEE